MSHLDRRIVALHTAPAGIVDRADGPRPYHMTDDDVAVFLRRALRDDPAGAISRPSGHPGETQHDTGMAEGWSRQQRVAAGRLEALWRKSKPIVGVPRGHANGCAPRGSLSEDEADDATRAWAEYRAALDQVTRQCGHAHADALRMVVVYGEPSPLARAWRVREALTVLAKWWSIK